jgi:hypothetical protein
MPAHLHPPPGFGARPRRLDRRLILPPQIPQLLGNFRDRLLVSLCDCSIQPRPQIAFALEVDRGLELKEGVARLLFRLAPAVVESLVDGLIR